jgi:hypothetical protein
MATALGAGILLDATLVRALLVPAPVALFGPWNWCLPKPARHLLRTPRRPPRPNSRRSPMPADPDRCTIQDQMDQARQVFHHLPDHATDTGLRRRSNGTKWTNEQLLFHMLFGYLITAPCCHSPASSASSPTAPAKRSAGSSTGPAGHST